MERTAKVDFATIQGGLFDKNTLGKSGQMREAMEGLGLSMRKMTSGEMAAQRASYRSLNFGIDETMSRTRGLADAMSGYGPAADGLIKAVVMTKAIAGGFHVAAAAVSAFKGNTEEAIAAFSKIPLIGGVISAGADLGRALAAPSEREKAERARLDQVQDQRRKRLGDAYELSQLREKNKAKSIESLAREGLMIGLNPKQQALAEIQNQADDQYKNANSAEVRTRIVDNSTRKIMEIKKKYAEKEKDDLDAIVSEQTATQLKIRGQGMEAELGLMKDKAKKEAELVRRAGGDRAESIAKRIEDIAAGRAVLMRQEHERNRVDELMGIRASALASAESASGNDLAARKIQLREQFRQIRQADRMNETGIPPEIRDMQERIGNLSAIQDQNQARIAAQTLPLLSAFANPTVAISGKQQREDAAKDSPVVKELQGLARKLDELIKASGVAVNVGNN